MPKIFSSFLSGFNVISKKKKRSSRRWRHVFLRFYVDLKKKKKKKGPSSEFCNFSSRFLRHTRERRCEPQLSTVFGGKQKRRFLAGEKTLEFAKFQCENAGKNFTLFCVYREHWFGAQLLLVGEGTFIVWRVRQNLMVRISILAHKFRGEDRKKRLQLKISDLRICLGFHLCLLSWIKIYLRLGGTGPKMHSTGIKPVTFFCGTILAWVGKFLNWGAQAVIWEAWP